VPSSAATTSVDPAMRVFHDLRNVLQLVLAHVDLAREELPAEHPARRHMESAKSATCTAAALVHHFTQSDRDGSAAG
jgi:hypothetical protein